MALMGEFSSHVLDYLVSMRLQEEDPWLADDLAIAALTVKLAGEGCVKSHHCASLMILGIAPEEVWPRIVAARKAKLGRLYEQFFPAELPPKKPPQSVRLSDERVLGGQNRASHPADHR